MAWYDTPINEQPLMDAEQVFAAMVEVLGTEEKAHRWLSRPNMALGREKPIDLLGTPEGRVDVLTILMRIEWECIARWINNKSPATRIPIGRDI